MSDAVCSYCSCSFSIIFSPKGDAFGRHVSISRVPKSFAIPSALCVCDCNHCNIIASNSSSPCLSQLPPSSVCLPVCLYSVGISPWPWTGQPPCLHTHIQHRRVLQAGRALD